MTPHMSLLQLIVLCTLVAVCTLDTKPKHSRQRDDSSEAGNR